MAFQETRELNNIVHAAIGKVVQEWDEKRLRARILLFKQGTTSRDRFPHAPSRYAAIATPGVLVVIGKIQATPAAL